MKLLALALAPLALLADSSLAQTQQAGSLEIADPWLRATPKGAAVAGGYMRIRNAGTSPDRLIGGSLDGTQRGEVHTMTMEGGVMRMREVREGLEIKPGETVELKPGSYHMMFIGLQRPLVQGAHVKGELRFEKAGVVGLDFAVQGMGAQAPSGSPHSSH